MLTALLAVDSSTNRRKSYTLTTFIFITNKKASQKKKLQTAFLVVDVSHAMAAGVIWTVKPTKQHEVNSQ